MLFSDFRLFLKYRRFGKIVETMGRDDRPLPSYESICAEIGVEPSELDKVLLAELGMCGKDYLEALERRLGK